MVGMNVMFVVAVANGSLKSATSASTGGLFLIDRDNQHNELISFNEIVTIIEQRRGKNIGKLRNK